jgi:hypothetical protein
VGALALVVVSLTANVDAETSALPALELNQTMFERGDTLVVTGHGCLGTGGIGSGALVDIRNGAFVVEGLDGPPVDGTWTFTYEWATTGLDVVAAGQFAVTARCFDNSPEGESYPPTSFVISPGAAPDIDGPLTLSTAVAGVGEAVTVTGTGFSNFQDAGLFLYPGPVYLGNSRPLTDGPGTMSTTVTIPPGTAPDTYSLVAQGLQPGGQPGDRLWTLAADVTVSGQVTTTTSTTVAPTTVSQTGPLAVTGSRHATGLSLLATVLIVAGIALTTTAAAIARKRAG